MSASDVEIDEQLVEAGSKLVDPPASVDELLALLDQVESCLAKVDQSPSKYMQEVLSVPLKALVGDRLFKHSDIDVRVAVASCMSEITRISAPEAPYEDDKMKEVFQLIVSSFKNLSDKSAQSYGKRCAILETAAKVRSCVLMLDLECDALILEMFHLFLKEIRDYHPESVFTAMETIMALVIEESEDVSPELLSSILETVKRDNEEVQPIVKKLGETILESCASKLKPYLSQLLKSSGVSSNDYSSVVSLICQGIIEGTEQNETCGLKLDEPTEEVTTLQQVDAAPDVSPESVISNSEEKEEKDSSLADSALVKKECGDDSNAAEKTKLSSTVELHKSVEKMEPQQDQTFERKGSNPKSSTEQVESADNKEKGVENDISTVASKKQSDEESLKEVVVEPSSSDADGKEPQRDASPPYSREEDQKKKGGAEEKKEHMIKDVKEVAEEIFEEKRSEDVVEKGNDGEDEKSSRADMDIDGTSDSVVKPLKKHNEEALYSKEASVEMGGDEVETPPVEADKISDKKPNSGQADNAIDATSDSEAKSLKQHKEEALSPIIGDEISTMQPENKKGQVNTSVKKGADNVTSDEKPSKINDVIDANSDSEAKSAKQRKKEAVSSRSGAGISTRKPQHKKGQPEGRKDSEKQAKASVQKDVDKIVSDEKTNQAEMDIDATSDSEAKFSKQHKKEASISSKKYPEDKKGHVKGRMISEKQVKTSSKKDIDKVIPDEKPNKADKDTDGTSDSETKSLNQRKKEGLSSSSGIAKRKPEAKITQDKGRTVSEKQIKTSVKKDVDQIISDEKPSKDIDATSDSEAKFLKQRKKEPVSSSRQAEGKKGQAKGKMVSEKQIKASTKKDVPKVLSDEEPSQDKDIDATSDSEAKPLRLRKKEASSSSGGISKRQQEDKKEQAKGKIVSEKPGKTSATKDLDKDKEVVSSSRTGNKRARDETHIDRSKKSTPAKEEKSNKKEFGKELVGSRIKVWWPLDKAYYEGKVSSFDPVKKKHKVSYVDGDIETLQLKDEKWKLVTDDSESDQEDQSEDEESLGASPERTPMKKGRTNLNRSSGKKEKIEASSKKNGVATSSGKSKEAAPISGGKNQRSKNGTKIAKSKENEVGTSKGSARSKQEISRTAKRKQEDDDDDDDDLPPTPKSKTPEVSGKSNTNGSGKAKSASKTLGDTKSLPEKKRRRVQ